MSAMTPRPVASPANVPAKEPHTKDAAAPESFDTYFARIVRRAPILVGIALAFFIIRQFGTRAGPVLLIGASFPLILLSAVRPEVGLYALVLNFVNEFDSYYGLQQYFPISLPILYDTAIGIGILFILAGGRRRLQTSYAHLWVLAAYVALVVFSVLASQVAEPDLWAQFRTQFLIRPIFFVFLVMIIADRQQLYRLLVVFLIAHTLLMTSAMSDYLQKGVALYRVRGTLTATNYLSYVCIATLPILISLYAYLRDRLARYAMLGLAFVTLFVSLQTLSRSGYYSLMATLGFLAVRFIQKPRTLAMALAFLAVFYVLVPEALTRRLEEVEDVTQTSRYYLSRIAWRMAADNPLLGVGAHAYEEMFPRYDFELLYGKTKAPHNLYLAIAAQSGFPALAAYLALFGFTFFQLTRIDIEHRRHRETREFDFFLTVGVESALIGHFVFGLAGSYGDSYYAYLLLGIAVILVRLQRAPSAEPR